MILENRIKHKNVILHFTGYVTLPKRRLNKLERLYTYRVLRNCTNIIEELKNKMAFTFDGLLVIPLYSNKNWLKS